MLNLNGTWKFKSVKSNEWLEMNVPTTVYAALLEQQLMPDPFYKENEAQVRDLCYEDYEFIKTFELVEADLMHQQIILNCEGIDTVGRLYLNDRLIGHVNNMHRHYKFDVTSELTVGENSLHIVLDSSLHYLAKKDEEKTLWGVTSTVAGYQHLRKAHSMFGWDWGPQLPDTGIFRNISLQFYNDVKVDDFYVTQHHSQDTVKLVIETECTMLKAGQYHLVCTLVSPEQDILVTKIVPFSEKQTIELTLSNPELWWPNGLGEQPLYEVCVEVLDDCHVIDLQTKRIGIRTLTVRKKHDEFGVGFCFEINGHDIFAMGANYIPEDNILGRCSYDKTKQLLQQCVDANFNCIRVWGGGLYPETYFYDLCDELGLIVWQDFMFACAVYDLTEEFKANIVAEIEDNIRRFRNHASLGLWCGNNEMEMGWNDWDIPNNKKLREDYLEMFERLIPELVKTYGPNTFYWPASPSSEGGFVNPNSDAKGDAHYWDVWHGHKPFEDFENYYFRFASEYGFQSFPSMKTVQTFATEEDYNIYSPVMEHHQKCVDSGHGNATIMHYMASYYLMPKDFESTLYASQLLQGDCLQAAIEHFRRHRGRCMGSTYWQLNDCWPVASWATIDNNGRLKASHYMVKRSYAPLLISAHHNKKTNEVSIVVVNETLNEFNGTVSLNLVHQQTGSIMQQQLNVSIKGLSKQTIMTFEYNQTAEASRNIYLRYELSNQEAIVSSNTLLFVRPKQFTFNKPQIRKQIITSEEKTMIELTSDVFARGVTVDFAGIDVEFDQNCIDLYPNESKTLVVTSPLTTNQQQILASLMQVTSVYDIAH